MHPAWCLLIILRCFIGTAIPRTISAGVQIMTPDVNESAQSPSILMPTRPGPNSGLAENAEYKEYAVIPLEQQKVADINEKIERFAVKGSIEMVKAEFGPVDDDVLFWSFKATQSDAQQLKEELGTDATLFEDNTAFEHAELDSSNTMSQSNITRGLMALSGVISQHNPPEDLKVVSWPRGTMLANLQNYVYRDDWKSKPTMYLIDNGLNPDSQDFQLGIDDWYYSTRVKREGWARMTDDSPNFHGSCVMSKAIGLMNGVYKNAINRKYKNSRLVVVKIDPGRALTEALWAFRTVFLDIRNRGRFVPNPAVVMFPFTALPNADPVRWDRVRAIMQAIFNLGGSIVVPSGNYAGRGRPRVDSPPASSESQNFPLIVVGAVNNRGQTASFSQGPDHVTTWAPGDKVVCAGRVGFREARGTSFSTGMVGGLVSYFLALNKVNWSPTQSGTAEVKNYLTNHAGWTRPGGQNPVVWNQQKGF